MTDSVNISVSIFPRIQKAKCARAGARAIMRLDL